MTSVPDDILDLLAAYALDALEPAEVAQVAALLAERPELRDTLAELRETVNRLPYALPEADPPPELRQRVLDRATGRAQPAHPAAPAALAGRARGWLLALGGLAAVALIAAVIGWVQLAGAHAELARARTQQQQQLEILARADTIARLKGDTGSSNGTLLRAADGRAVLTAELPPLQSGRVYQLWVIQGQNSPVSAGTFTVDQQGHGLLTLSSSGQAPAAATVAVTDEPFPGSQQPTTTPLIVGQVPSA